MQENKNLMSSFVGPDYSDFQSEKELIFKRGINVSHECSLLSKVFGLCLLLIPLIKTIFNAKNSINFEWPLFFVGLIFFVLGLFLSRSKVFQNLFSIKSKAFTEYRSIVLHVVFFLTIFIVIFIRSTAVNIETYKGYFFGEGGILEWSQVLVLLFSIRFGILIIKDLFLKRLLFNYRMIYIFITSFLLIIFLEEIAWGQVIFSWKTPEVLSRLNAQGEMTLHNIDFFQNILDISFFYISLSIFIFVVATSLLATPLQKRLKFEPKYLLKLFLPPIYSWPLFFSTLFISFLVAKPLFASLIINRDQEWAELFLYAGILITLLRTYILLDKPTNRLNKIMPYID